VSHRDPVLALPVAGHAAWGAVDVRAVDRVRLLAADAVQKAGNGHPGTAMSLAPLAYLLFGRGDAARPGDDQWLGRDRFLLSCGHSSLTLYIQLYLCGYGLELSDLQALRTWDSATPGHPEYRHTRGVEITTGPLGQGLASAVGMAMAARRERGLLDPDASIGQSPFDHHVYVLASDGDLMEGVSAEASSLAGHQQLGSPVVFYDSNHISIEDDTDISFSEDVAARYAAYGWHVQTVDWTATGGLRRGRRRAAGVSVWLDDLSRELFAGRELESLIADKHVVGVTTNPTIFASALSKGDRYTDQLRQLADSGASLDDAVFAITTIDVRSGCRVLRGVYEATGGVNGRVSIEVDPRLARDTDATVTQPGHCGRLSTRPTCWSRSRQPGEGLAAIATVTGAGISVNVTLIFALDRYAQVMDAHLTGLEQAHRAGHDLSAIHSVASFFVSRVDTDIDARLDAIGTPEAVTLKGKAAVANARLAYQAYEQVIASDRWQALAAAGARGQRPLGLHRRQGPRLPRHHVRHRLVAAGTVNTMPGSTLAAFADHHGTLAGDTVHANYLSARAHLEHLQRIGIDYEQVTDTLEREGLIKFENSWEELGVTVARELHTSST